MAIVTVTVSAMIYLVYKQKQLGVVYWYIFLVYIIDCALGDRARAMFPITGDHS